LIEPVWASNILTDTNSGQDGKFIERYGCQFTVLTSEDDQIAENLVVIVPSKMQSVPPAFGTNDGPDGLGGPRSKAHFDLMFQFNPIARL
jgi:hypothetical protein